jgi:hypothetical protein
MPAITTAEPRAEALALLQTIDPQGAYSDRASAKDNRHPCTLGEAITATATVVEAAFPGGDVPGELAQLFSALALWAWDEGHKTFATGYHVGRDHGTAQAQPAAA